MRKARKLDSVLALDDFEERARLLLPRRIFGFISGHVERGQSYHASRSSFLNYSFRPRVLTDTRGRSQAAELFGRERSAPFGISPMGGCLMAAFDGDMTLARAAARRGVQFILSGSALTRLEEVASVGSPWFQAYLPGGKPKILPFLDRIRGAGFETLVVTVDVPVMGNRENNLRVGFRLPVRPSPGLAWDALTHPAWLIQWMRTMHERGMPHFENMGAERGPPVFSRSLDRNLTDRDGLSWDDLDFVRDRWPGRLVLKGVLRGDDAARARSMGADGLIVSNHGGRQLDGAVAPLHALPEIAAEKGGMTIMLDGAVRRGTDVLKALALGADYVFVGRPFLWAAAIGGEAAVEHAIALLMQEIDRDMALLGVTRLSAIRPDLLAWNGGAPPRGARPVC